MTSRSNRIIKTPLLEELSPASPPQGDLYSVPEKSQVQIKQVTGSRTLREQLKQMGIFAGDLVMVKRRVPFGGALLIEHRGTQLALSKILAEQILVENPA